MPKENPNLRVGAVLVFESEVEKERVLRWVQKLKEAGHLASSDVREFDSSHDCWPVFYIP